MKERNIVAMFGVSGVGKGWLARRLCERRPEIVHLEASALMMGALGVSPEALRTSTSNEVTSNQHALVSAFAAARDACPSRPILFDGHSVIDNDAGLVEIPLEVIAALTPGCIVFVSEKVSVIAQRRRNDHRERPVRTLGELADHQKKAKATTLTYARGLDVPFEDIRAGDLDALEDLFINRPSTTFP